MRFSSCKALSSLLCVCCLLIIIAPQSFASLTPLNDDEFVKQIYSDFLKREMAPDELNNHINQLNTGANDRSELVDQLLRSPEFQANIAPVVRLYFTYFLRLPDYGGLMFWINSYQQGMSLDDISEEFAKSPEFNATYGQLSNQEYVNKMYLNIYDREPDLGGLDFWSGHLVAERLTRGQVMVEFSAAPEYLEKSANQVYVAMTYKGLLRRAPEQGEFDSWVEIIDQGASGLGLIDSVLFSDEYAARFDVNAESAVNGTNFEVSYVLSEVPNIPEDVAGTSIFNGLNMVPLIGRDGRNRLMLHPTYFYDGADYPPYEFIEEAPGSDRYVLNKVHSEVATSMVRNFKVYKHADYTAMYIADQGKEVPSDDGSHANFPFGDVFVAKDYGNGFEYQQISGEYKAFYHSVDAYDIDGNGYEDVAAVNMGVYGGPYQYDSVHLFMQNNEGEYTQVQFAPGFEIGHSTGSLRFADLDNDGNKELIQSAYFLRGWAEFDYGAFKVWKLNDSKQYEEHTVVPRQGLWAEPDYGCARTKVLDYNNDGLLDILFFMEKADEHGIELFINEGNLQFRRVTNEVLPMNYLYSGYFVTRDFDLADVNSDGFTDIIMNPFIRNSSDVRLDDTYDVWFNDVARYDLGEAIWLNAGGEQFVKMSDREDLLLSVPGKLNIMQNMKFFKFEDGVIKFIGITTYTDYNGYNTGSAPMVFNIKVY